MLKTKIAAVALGAVTLASSFALTPTQAQASNYNALAIGVGAFALGAIVASQYGHPVYIAKTKHCDLVPVYNSYGYIVYYQKQCSWY